MLTFVVAGFANKRTAGELGTSEITVGVHRGQIMRKMNACSLADLVRSLCGWLAALVAARWSAYALRASARHRAVARLNSPRGGGWLAALDDFRNWLVHEAA